MSLLKLEKRAGVAVENTTSFLAADVERLDGCDRLGDQTPALLRIERRVGGKQTPGVPK